MLKVLTHWFDSLTANRATKIPGPHYDLRDLTYKGNQTSCKSGVTIKSRPSPHIYPGIDTSTKLKAKCLTRKWNDDIYLNWWADKQGFRQHDAEQRAPFYCSLLLTLNPNEYQQNFLKKKEISSVLGCLDFQMDKFKNRLLWHNKNHTRD